MPSLFLAPSASSSRTKPVTRSEYLITEITTGDVQLAAADILGRRLRKHELMVVSECLAWEVREMLGHIIRAEF